MFLNTCRVVPGLCQASVIGAGWEGAALGFSMVGAGPPGRGDTGCSGWFVGADPWVHPPLGCGVVGLCPSSLGKGGFSSSSPQEPVLGPPTLPRPLAVPPLPQGSCLAGLPPGGGLMGGFM